MKSVGSIASSCQSCQNTAIYLLTNALTTMTPINWWVSECWFPHCTVQLILYSSDSVSSLFDQLLNDPFSVLRLAKNHYSRDDIHLL